ncbi:MAG: protoglobin domain-containing protein [Sandaracinaceae bacterium]|nr:protoglobin domain-containing protein [Sandaracinaceae bacterium]
MTSKHQEITHYVRFSPALSQKITRCKDLVFPQLARVSEIFYERVREHEEAHAVFQNEAQIDRLRVSLVQWLKDLFRGPHDDAHFVRTAQVGKVHVKIGLPARYMVTGMSVLRTELTQILLRENQIDAAQALSLLLDVELGVMVDAYWSHFKERIQAMIKWGGNEKQEERDELIDALDGLGIVVLGLDKDNRIAYANLEAERITGYKVEELIGLPCESLLPDGEINRIGPQEQQHSFRHLTTTLLTRSGRSREVRPHLVPVKEGLRGLQKVIGLLDMTKEIEWQKRTHQAERLAAVGRLAAGLAHEIRNPLNGAHLHLMVLERILKRHLFSEKEAALESLETVVREIQRLSALVSEFLEFARPRPLSLRPIAVCELCRYAAHLLQPDAQRHGVQIKLDLPPATYVIMADRDKLCQVLINLVRNSIEAIAAEGSGGPKGEERGHVILRARRRPRHIMIEVEDNGPGIPDPNAPIFDAFYSTKPNGTGLGLPIAHRIVQDHGGSLSFESISSPHPPHQRRTIFRIELPLPQELQDLSENPVNSHQSTEDAAREESHG